MSDQVSPDTGPYTSGTGYRRLLPGGPFSPAASAYASPDNDLSAAPEGSCSLSHDSPADILLFCQYLPHHRTAQYHCILSGQSSCLLSTSPDRCTDGYRNMTGDFTAPVTERNSLSPVCPPERPRRRVPSRHFQPHSPRRAGAPFGYASPCHLLHQHLLITRRIKRAQPEDAKIRLLFAIASVRAR